MIIMKKSLNIRIVIFVSLVFATLLSCSSDDDGNLIPVPDATLVEVASQDPDLSILVSALEQANLTDMLNGTGPFTVLAPTNDAFSAFLSGAGFASVSDVPLETLRQILLYHIIKQQVDATFFTSLQRNYLVNEAAGPPGGTNLVIYLDATNGIIFNGTSKVTKSDIPASNGIIHKVDGVIDIPTLDTFISVDFNFEDLEASMDIISPLSTLPAMLKDTESGPFTLFAPAEHAFDNLLDTNGEWNSVSDIDETYLTAIMEHHVVSDNLLETDIKPGEMATTFEGDNIMFSSLNGNIEIKDGAGNEGTIIGVFNIQASNGVIHLLPTQVLLPDITN
jgi:uncharacterized surface protein with fasciclin (FAS1) repeats